MFGNPNIDVGSIHNTIATSAAIVVLMTALLLID
jgi:hypothetical protein